MAHQLTATSAKPSDSPNNLSFQDEPDLKIESLHIDRRSRKEDGIRCLALFVPLIVAVLLSSACKGSGGSTPPPDLNPVGEGLKVVAFALIGAAFVLSFGRSFGNHQ
jgi:hypothetical protein